MRQLGLFNFYNMYLSTRLKFGPNGSYYNNSKMKKTFIIALIITLAISQKLVLVKSITNNLLDANYPDCFQNIPKA